MYKLLIPILYFASVTTMLAQTPCENGLANGYPCNQVDFYAQINNATLSGTSGVEGNDIWGWTDPETGVEYALMGQTNGTVFVDLSDPANPRIVGRLRAHQNTSTLWRDIKVYNNHAFIVSESGGHGMQVFDLSRLRGASTTSITAFTEDAHYDGVSSAHNIVINEEEGYAYIVGARGASNGCGAGGLHIVDISNPTSPAYAGCFDADGYTHDAQVVTYKGPDTAYQGQQIAFNSNENTITIANVEDPTSTSLISKQSYASSAYAHQGWLTEDHQFFFSNDELDESRGLVNKTRTLIWDVRDLDNPKLINSYYSERNTIDHNLYTQGGKIFQSNYESGLIILDATKAGEGKIREVAYFDTYPSTNGVNFNGTWSNYPYFESGIVVISDINRGLIIVKPSYQNIITAHPSFNDCANQRSISISVKNENDVALYQWQSVKGSNIIDLNESATHGGVNTATLSLDATKSNIVGLSYRCKVTLNDGSESTSFPTNEFSTAAIADFSYNNRGFTVNFSNSSTAADTFEWDFGDGSEPSTEVQPSHTYAENGEYTVTLKATNGCGTNNKTEVLDLRENVTANASSIEQSVSIFPVPANNQLNIQLNDLSVQLKSLSIYNTTGKLVYQEAFDKNASINMSSWNKGMYFAIFETIDNQQFSKKILKK